MYRSEIAILVLALCILLAPQTKAQDATDSSTPKRPGAPTIALNEFEVNDNSLKLSYVIRNDSEKDAWILTGRGKSAPEIAVFMDKDGQTLLLQSRFDLPTSRPGEYIYGRYVRMRPGQIQTESISLPIPVHPHYGFGFARREQGIEYATQIVIEIGYYIGDFPSTIHNLLTEAEKLSDKGLDYYVRPADYEKRYAILERYFEGLLIKDRWFKGLSAFNQLNELSKDRDNEILIPYTEQSLKGEQVLQITVDGLMIPYEEKEEQPEKLFTPNLPPCTKIEIQYQPSMLEYFFPHQTQQSFLSPTERQNLISLRTVVVNDQEQIKALTHDLSLGTPFGGVDRERTIANVVCYCDEEHLKNFAIYNDASIVTEVKYRFFYFNGFPSLRMLTPQVKPLELRIECANNLKNLWQRFISYHIIEKIRKPSYPVPEGWCDAMVQAYPIDNFMASIVLIDVMKPFRCHSAGEGKCHYAMNPNCKLDSPPDMVLLFETKAGWNQHGGPELFTFDNHDPRGGCVLLNDGTVKFIRTKEELQQLRWK